MVMMNTDKKWLTRDDEHLESFLVNITIVVEKKELGESCTCAPQLYVM